ncbi:MAG: hypothetical protein WAW36_16600, partial [Methylovulum miyakonense]|uniref:hypothetical protein n=1 Tax=Methylovulum miyakonense TaxID=645578 RepID=UPI003BB4DCDD
PDAHDALGKFRRQINDLSSHVEVWWLWVNSLLTDAEAVPPLQHWIKHQLLPVVYWHHQQQQTQKKGQREAFQQAREQASQRLAQASLPRHVAGCVKLPKSGGTERRGKPARQGGHDGPLFIGRSA